MDGVSDSLDRLLLESDEEEEDLLNDDSQPALLRMEDAADSDGSLESSEDENESESGKSGWRKTFKPKQSFSLSDQSSGIQDDAVYGFTEAIQFWRLFVTDGMVELILTEANIYACAKYNQWSPLEEEELFIFFGICLQMGLEKRPKLTDYWSTRCIFSPSFTANLVSRSRFTQILNSLHFAENELVDPTNRLCEFQSILDMLNESFLKIYRPGKDVTIDESMVPSRGRVIFRQYVKGKRHRFGIKLFKICSRGGYTCKLQVYAGKQKTKLVKKVDAGKNEGFSICTKSYTADQHEVFSL